MKGTVLFFSCYLLAACFLSAALDLVFFLACVCVAIIFGSVLRAIYMSRISISDFSWAWICVVDERGIGSGCGLYLDLNF